MGVRKLVGRVRRLVGRAFFHDRTFISQESGTLLKFVQFKALFPDKSEGFKCKDLQR